MRNATGCLTSTAFRHHLCGLYRPEGLKAVLNCHTHTVAGRDHDLCGGSQHSLFHLPGHSPGELAMMAGMTVHHM